LSPILKNETYERRTAAYDLSLLRRRRRRLLPGVDRIDAALEPAAAVVVVCQLRVGFPFCKRDAPVLPHGREKGRQDAVEVFGGGDALVLVDLAERRDHDGPRASAAVITELTG
jgi:hypothetical protein